MIVDTLKERWRKYHKENGRNPQYLEVTKQEYLEYRDYLFPNWEDDPKAYKTIKELYFYGKQLKYGQN